MGQFAGKGLMLSPSTTAWRRRSLVFAGNVGRTSLRLRLWELPRAVQNFRARTIEPYRVIPAGRHRQAVWNLPVTPTELNGNGAIGGLFAGNVVDGVGIEVVLLKKALRVVDADRPEAVQRNVVDTQPVDGLAVVFLGRNVEIDRLLFGDCRPIPTRCRPDALPGRLLPFPERPLVVGYCRNREPATHHVFSSGSPISLRYVEIARALLR